MTHHERRPVARTIVPKPLSAQMRDIQQQLDSLAQQCRALAEAQAAVELQPKEEHPAASPGGSPPLDLKLAYLNDPCRLIRARELAELFHVHPMTIAKWRKKRKLPPPVKITAQVVGWPASSIADFIEQRKETEAKNDPRHS
jgi:predicted DNA-binding transcriptional regulator AlpA